MPVAESLTDRVIELAIEAHRHADPGLLESVYERCLCRELEKAGIIQTRQARLPLP